MNPEIISALQITAAGMGLVFMAILALWLVMVLIVKLGSPQKENLQPDERYSELEKVAAAAVALALAERSEGKDLHEFPLPPTAIVSAWQAVMRGKMLNKRGSVK